MQSPQLSFIGGNAQFRPFANSNNNNNNNRKNGDDDNDNSDNIRIGGVV